MDSINNTLSNYW